MSSECNISYDFDSFLPTFLQMEVFDTPSNGKKRMINIPYYKIKILKINNSIDT